MYEPLWVGILLPSSVYMPWCFKRSPLLVELRRDLREVLSEGEKDGGDILQKLLKLPGLVASTLQHMACRVLHVPGRTTLLPDDSHIGRVGQPWHKEEERHKRLSQGVDKSHMCIPFQCKVCWMRNLEGRDPLPERDDVYKAYIKRENLDAMLGKLPLTIANHVRETRAVIKNAELINKTPLYYPRRPYPLGNSVGMGLAVDMELKSLVARGCIREHVQFFTLRHLRTTHTKAGNLLLSEWWRVPHLPKAWVVSGQRHVHLNLSGFMPS
jgi:hypothetical protein